MRLLFAAIDGARLLVRYAGPFAGLLALAAAVEAARQVLPPYVRHHAFKDEVVDLAAASTNDDAGVRGAILRAAERRSIPLSEERLHVRLENNERTVRFAYEVSVRLLPSLEPRLLRFSVDVVQPAFAREGTGPPQ
jgi:hypothetical protein